MLKLYGFAVSNYYNMVKLALLEKDLPFEEVPFYAGQTPEALAISPRGKVPVLGVPQGFINETAVILPYIDDTQPGPKLLPADPFQRARVLALAKEIELYIELPARASFA
ncbi:glutathione S-transferase family protein, partial [Pseudomonas sp.]|uniref:glutathione S-transferase family protein n=2 Tax=Pseudomonas TaxID=286 RepID=UPI003F99449B